MAPERFQLPTLQCGSSISDYPQFPEIIRIHRVVWPRVTELFAAGLTRATSMAKSDSDSNGLRQDQPECPLAEPGGLGGRTPKGCAIAIVSNAVRRLRHWPDVTELPGLTSDPILTADRRGGILISFGPYRTPRGRISPSDCLGSGRPGFVGPDRAVLRIRTECPVPLKGVGSFPAGIRIRQGCACPVRMPCYT